MKQEKKAWSFPTSFQTEAFYYKFDHSLLLIYRENCIADALVVVNISKENSSFISGFFKNLLLSNCKLCDYENLENFFRKKFYTLSSLCTLVDNFCGVQYEGRSTSLVAALLIFARILRPLSGRQLPQTW